MVFCSTEKERENLSEEVAADKEWGERKLEEEMNNLGETVLVRPAAPTHPLLCQNLDKNVGSMWLNMAQCGSKWLNVADHLLAVHVANKLLLSGLHCHSQLWIGCVLASTLTEVL